MHSLLHGVLTPLLPVAKIVVSPQSIHRFSHNYAKKRYLEYLTTHLNPDWVNLEVEDGPVMSKRLRLLTRSLDEKSYEAEYSGDQFFYESYKQVYHFFNRLERYNFNLRTCGSILDFGCGSARILRLYRYMDGVRLVGCDANPECIAWCKENVPGCEFYVNELAPPLPFPDGNQFDLVVSLSVFTHIPLGQQAVWLEEMKRVLKPGGFLLCTVAGTFHVDVQLGADGRRLLRQQREISLGTNDPGVSLSTKAGGSHYDVFQTRDRVIEVFGSVLKLRDYIPYTWAPIGLDMLILQKA
jgi:SAM-dependent methyltransferase